MISSKFMLTSRAGGCQAASGRARWGEIARRQVLPYINRAMALRRILLHPDPRLRAPAKPVTSVDAALRRLAEDMLETMYDAPGIGLAAPQVGQGIRLVVMDCAKGEEEPRPLVLLNPRVTWASEEVAPYEEGCLSIPEHYAEVTRPVEVDVAWTDLDGREQGERMTGLWAVCTQHEIDHLDGKLFIDRIGPIRRQMITRKMEKLKRDLAREAAPGAYARP
jgi:peptide deformylase